MGRLKLQGAMLAHWKQRAEGGAVTRAAREKGAFSACLLRARRHGMCFPLDSHRTVAPQPRAAAFVQRLRPKASESFSFTPASSPSRNRVRTPPSKHTRLQRLPSLRCCQPVLSSLLDSAPCCSSYGSPSDSSRTQVKSPKASA